MGSRYGYQSKGNTLSIRVGWWVVMLVMAFLWLQKPLPLPMVKELMLALLWFMGIVSLVLLVGRLVRGRRNDWPTQRLYCLQNRPLPNYLALFHKRQRKRHLIFKRRSRLS